MLTGPELGAALKEAMRKKGVKQDVVAHEFHVTQPSVSEWIKLGRIAKQHIPTLLSYFGDVVGPSHWGLPFSDEEFALILAFRDLHPESQRYLLENVKAAAATERAARLKNAPILGIHAHDPAAAPVPPVAGSGKRRKAA